MEAIRAAPTATSWLVFDAEAVTYIDATGIDTLGRLTSELRRDGVTLVVARMRTRIREELDEAGILDLIGREHDYPTVARRRRGAHRRRFKEPVRRR